MLLVDYDNYNKIYTILKEREDSFSIGIVQIGQAMTNQKTKYKVNIAKIDYKIERS